MNTVIVFLLTGAIAFLSYKLGFKSGERMVLNSIRTVIGTEETIRFFVDLKMKARKMQN